MDMQSTHIMNKICLILISVLCIISLTSCKKKIPEGDIKDFVERFDFDETYKNITYASSTVTSSHYVDNVLQGTITTYTYIDLVDGKYHYSKTVLSGSYYGNGEDQFNYYEQETITYLDEVGNVIAYALTDGVLETLTYRPEDLGILINNFFYTDSEYGYHKGGTYYGDYILANCAKHYHLFSLNDDKTILNYHINTFYDGKDNQKILIMHEFNVNEWGMIINLSTKSIDENNHNTYSQTTMDCDYETRMDKIYDFIVKD